MCECENSVHKIHTHLYAHTVCMCIKPAKYHQGAQDNAALSKQQEQIHTNVTAQTPVKDSKIWP